MLHLVKDGGILLKSVAVNHIGAVNLYLIAVCKAHILVERNPQVVGVVEGAFGFGFGVFEESGVFLCVDGEPAAVAVVVESVDNHRHNIVDESVVHAFVEGAEHFDVAVFVVFAAKKFGQAGLHLLTDKNFHIFVVHHLVVALAVADKIVIQRVGEAEGGGEAQVGVAEADGHGENGVGVGGGLFEHLANLVVLHAVVQEPHLYVGNLVYVAVARTEQRIELVHTVVHHGDDGFVASGAFVVVGVVAQTQSFEEQRHTHIVQSDDNEVNVFVGFGHLTAVEGAVVGQCIGAP